MIKNYSTYIKESTTAVSKFKLKEFIGNHRNLATAEKALQDMVVGQLCQWRTKGIMAIRKEVIERATLATNLYGGMNYYFNGFSVDDNSYVEVYLRHDEVELVGFPSGEVLFITQGQAQTLIDTKLIKFENWIIWREIEYKNIFYFKDKDYHEIKSMLDINYKKPVKKNIEKKNDYKVGDVVVCKGKIEFKKHEIILQDRVGKITLKMTTGDQKSYRIKFFMNFIEELGNEIWVSFNNIAGLYTGDIEAQKALALMQRNQDLEEHEVDDDYHLNQLYKNEPKESNSIKIGDDVFLDEQKSALYQIDQEEFVNVWFKPGHILGKVQDIADIQGHACAKTSKTGAWYKISCIKK